MTEQKRSVKLCYDLTKKVFPSIPQVKAFERKVKEIPALALIRYRDGKEAFKNYLPHMERDKSNLLSNDIWNSDHKHRDFMAKTKDGKIERPYLTGWADIKSGKILSWIIRFENPNVTVVKKSLRLAMEKHGVPDEVYTDNGKDYRAREFSQDYPDSVISVLGINKIYATPYHGQAKPIERFWRTVNDRFCKLFYSYIGSSPEERPEHMKKTNKELEKDPNIPTIEYIIEQFDNYVKEYNDLPHSGYGMDGKSPNQVYAENLKNVRKVSDPNILKLFCGRIQERTVQRNGVQIYSTFFFNYDGLLTPYYNKKVKVCYDPDDMEILFIFDMDFNFICTAETKLKSPFRSRNEAQTTEIISPQYSEAEKAFEDKPKRKISSIWQEMNEVYELEKEEVI